MTQKIIVGAGLLFLAAMGTLPAAAQPYSATRTGDIVRLEDAATQTVVAIITSVGNMAYGMTVKGHNILRFPFASVDDYRAKPARVGIIVHKNKAARHKSRLSSAVKGMA